MNRHHAGPGSFAALDMYTEMTLRTSEWTVPIDIICCHDSSPPPPPPPPPPPQQQQQQQQPDVAGEEARFSIQDQMETTVESGDGMRGTEDLMERGGIDCEELERKMPAVRGVGGRMNLVCLLALNFSLVARQGCLSSSETTPPASIYPPRQIPRQAPRSQPHTLIIYSADPRCSSDLDALADRLAFFLAQGILPHRQLHFVVVMAVHPRQSSSAHAAFATKWQPALDALAARQPNFEWHALSPRLEMCGDAAAFRTVLREGVQLRVAVASIQQFLLVSSTLHGPFVPTYYHKPWPEIFLGMLVNRAVVSGLQIECRRARDAHLLNDNSSNTSHVTTPLQTVSIHSGLAVFSRHGALEEVQEALDAHVGLCAQRGNVDGHADDESLGWERILSHKLLQLNGRSLAVSAPMWKGVNLKNSARVSAICGHLRRSVLHPFEVVFVPTISWHKFGDEARRRSSDMLKRLQRVTLSARPWTIPLCAICPHQRFLCVQASGHPAAEASHDSPGRSW